MIELLFIVCLRTEPAACEERSLPALQEVGVQSCLAQAPPRIAAWSEAHPKLQVVRWTCRQADAHDIHA